MFDHITVKLRKKLQKDLIILGLGITAALIWRISNAGKRADYVDAIWNVVNWDMINSRYREAIK
jgi:hypothetical protein